MWARITKDLSLKFVFPPQNTFQTDPWNQNRKLIWPFLHSISPIKTKILRQSLRQFTKPDNKKTFRQGLVSWISLPSLIWSFLLLSFSLGWGVWLVRLENSTIDFLFYFFIFLFYKECTSCYIFFFFFEKNLMLELTTRGDRLTCSY